MSKLDRIRHFLNENKAGLAIVSDPVTVNYLTGLIVTHMNAKCSSSSTKIVNLPSLFLLLRLHVPLLYSTSQSLVMWTLKIHGKK